MKHRAFYLLFLFMPFMPFYPNEQAWMRDNYTKKELYITMRDGVKLFTCIYIPKNKGKKHPILITRTPYSCMPYGDKKFSAGQWPDYWRRYCRENYILVRQDVRGRWMSEGNFADVRPFIPDKKTNTDTDEAGDAYDTIEWLLKNIPSHNGRVGVIGTSYPGFYSAMAGACGHPAIKAISPQAPVTDWFIGDDFHHNGAFFMMDAFTFFSSFGKPRPKPTTTPAKRFNFPDKDVYQFYLETGSLKSLNKLMGDSIQFWKEIYKHPDYDDWWKARDARRAMDNIRPAVLVVGGLFDAENCFGALNLYKSIEKQSLTANNKIVMGPWHHGQWSEKDGSFLGDISFGTNTSAWYQNNIEIPFFNYYLKNENPDPKLAEATIFFSGENKWRTFNKWPPYETDVRAIYMEAGGNLSWKKPNSTTSFTAYTSDPSNPVPWIGKPEFKQTKEYMIADQRFASNRKDVLTFQTPLLNEDLIIAGPVTADLKVRITTSDADFVVKIIDVFPKEQKMAGTVSDKQDGYQMLVRGEIMRGRYRTSFEKPEAFKPDSIETVKFELPDIAHTFKKGHRLMIQVQSTWFPLADRNPQKFVNIYEADEKDFQRAVIRIQHDAINSSNILLPVLK